MRPPRIAIAALLGGLVLGVARAATAPVSADEAKEIAIDAYVYAYPLVLMDVTRRVSTNVAAPDTELGFRAPMNQFAHAKRYPDAGFTDVVRPNADTLYSWLWYDVTREPLVIHVPDSDGRYYLLPMLDLWTDVFASPGKRTTGTGEQVFAIAAPGWRGTAPPGVTVLRSPTAVGWMIGRTQTNGPDDHERVHRFQAGLTATPLSRWGTKASPPAAGTVDPKLDMSPPVEQVKKMDAATFFARFAALAGPNPPHGNDYPILQRMVRIGIVPGKPFDLGRATPEVKAALEAAPMAGTGQILATIPRMGSPVNGWRMISDPIGTYGTAYLRRAAIAYSGLGANVMQDAIYPAASRDGDGKPFDSGARYVVHFGKGQIPPVRAFWSLTLYDARQLFAANAINRYAIGSRDPLQFNDDGSLDLYVQRASPGPDKERNWLPTPAAGEFSMNLRLYWPGPTALEGAWAPPPVKRIE
ncbi:MAG TPA: DUF1254 domain-containing protein [Candidatus Binatia bacterium]|nr:DUF1254 domain-containing protein [Candidatus Binatia bacterium]